ncbi:MAG: SIMPL domain-containing protein [Oscillospiraceae bacterium]|nr:SIMPL domain-containing protein [Oscillospiraceae bacterium]
MRTIRVTGKGQLSLAPDLTRITMTLEGLCPEYSETLRRSSEDTEALRELLSRFGFARSDLKTLNFSVDAEYESIQERGSYKQRFVGYRFHHSMKVEFDSDNQRLGKLLYALANAPVKTEFRITYTVKDPESAKNELLGRAVKDAAAKAAVLAEAAGLSLGAIQSIDYSFGELIFDVQPMNRMLMADRSLSAKESYDLNIEPDCIQVSDTVTLVWEIC